MNYFLVILFIVLNFFSFKLVAQDDLLELLEQEQEEQVVFSIATFKTTRIINGHSIETPSKGVLQFMISHRFGRVNSGSYEFFGLDNATIRLGLHYGINDRFTVGIGRSSFEKTYDAYLKYKLLRQKSGKENFPLSVTLFSSAAAKTIEWSDPLRKNYTSSRMYYTYQALIARKFNSNFSLQISPTLIHRNLVATTADENDVYAIGAGARQKLSGSLSLNVEYFYVLPDQIISPLYGEEVVNTLSVGLDIETGGHVFQLHLTNSRGMIEKFFITETTGAWDKGDIHFGFNISRVFNVSTKK